MMNSEIRDQAYQFFIEEAPDLLQIIESGLLTIREDRSIAKVHEIMRAAHSIKGGAASVGLDTIKTLAHRIEDIFKAFYDETVIIDQQLESLLLQAYDCLKNPLTQQLNTGSFDQEFALETALPILETLETLLGDSLAQGDQYIASSADLGVDIVASIFEVDIMQALEQLAGIIAKADNYDVVQELRTTAEIFQGLAELLNLPGFGAITQALTTALDHHPQQAVTIAHLALTDFRDSCHQVLEKGDRTQGGQPSAALLALTQTTSKTPPIPSPVFSLDNLFEEELELTPLISVSEEEQAIISLSEPISSNSSDFGDILPLDDIFAQVNPELDFFEAATSPEASVDESFLIPSLDDVFGDFGSLDIVSEAPVSPENLDTLIQSVEGIFDQLPPLPTPIEENDDLPVLSSRGERPFAPTNTFESPSQLITPSQETLTQIQEETAKEKTIPGGKLSVRVDFNRLEKMNNLVGELVINRNSLSLQNEQIQGSVKGLLNRFSYFQKITSKLREFSDEMLVTPETYRSVNNSRQTARQSLSVATDFDSLEMDSYGNLYYLLQNLLEEMIQLEESVDDIVLFARSSNQTLEQQRQMLTNLRDELMWAKMLPLGEVLNRFPRVLRDLCTTYNKSVKLKLIGTGVLVDKAALEKLYDPLLHLLRNAFDHGIETPDIRQQLGKSPEAKIEIRAYHQGNQTIIEIRDDGSGLNLEKIAQKAIMVGLLTPEEIAVASKETLQNLIFQPGFSTASQVSELSGRGVGLDVVREQLHILKGNVSVSSITGKGTTFTLRLPFTLTIAKLLVCLINQEGSSQTTAFALPSDSIEEIIMPQAEQIKTSGNNRFLYWKQQIIPMYPLQNMLDYRCPVSESFASKSLHSMANPDDWGFPLLILRRGDQLYALEVSRLVTEQELVIKPFGSAMAAPTYTYGCTILGDGTLIPVINGSLLIEYFLDPIAPNSDSKTILPNIPEIESSVTVPSQITPTVLVVDDSAALRRTLALTLQKSGYRVVQAKDGREALEQLEQSSGIKLVICDVEMPNMNGFEFLGQRRRDPELMKIPVAMLTSRSSDKHRQLATHLGASAYFTKPYIEQQFLASVKNMMN
ncbi:hybrid sensor histidine kinase/response regulator [Aphanothece sacrum]|uniref:histidine kinase n=1 Tax=Aphanothece sacrum FPU1 TaxID=1920663 RepID=A0A401IL49_APHSA|nr:hybrid sensor histidine kinase/response regulator [Aphanothece sacrum]GBF81979.1 CheA like protein [Aphanothece sacrum FPU1]GBF83609.1 CheA like protein [Aphanothece sacrum FPU3]